MPPEKDSSDASGTSWSYPSDSRRIRSSKSANPLISPESAGSPDATLMRHQRSISPPSPPSESLRASAVVSNSPARHGGDCQRQLVSCSRSEKTTLCGSALLRPFKDWDAVEISTWVKLILRMPEHSQTFLDNDVNGELATMLGAEELGDLVCVRS